MSETRVPIGVRIGVIREHRGMTQTELAERAGTSQGAISMIESGQRSPSWDMAERLADALGARLSFALQRLARIEALEEVEERLSLCEDHMPSQAQQP